MRREPLNPFADDVRAGLSAPLKTLPARWLYDELGSALFEAITALPEYELARADARLLQDLSPQLARSLTGAWRIAEFGSGSGRKTAHLLRALGGRAAYHPIDVSTTALDACQRELRGLAPVLPETGDYLAGLAQVLHQRQPGERLLVLFLGSSLGNFSPREASEFLAATALGLQPGDALLLGVDLARDPALLIPAYDDGAGVTAAFNRNVLGRINRELGADFVLRDFAHEARWNAAASRVEMHLRARRALRASIPGAGIEVEFACDETLWTESSYKFSLPALDQVATRTGWRPAQAWIDSTWPCAELLWMRA